MYFTEDYRVLAQEVSNSKVAFDWSRSEGTRMD